MALYRRAYEFGSKAERQKLADTIDLSATSVALLSVVSVQGVWSKEEQKSSHLAGSASSRSEVAMLLALDRLHSILSHHQQGHIQSQQLEQQTQ